MACVVYYTATKQTYRYISKIDDKHRKVELHTDKETPIIGEPFILVLPSYEPNVNPELYYMLEDFLEDGDNLDMCVGIFSGGNRNFAQLFGITANEIAKDYGLEILHRFEFQGEKRDVEKLEGELEKIG